MSVSSSLLVDGIAQLETFLYGIGGEREHLPDALGYLAVRKLHMTASVSIDIHTHRFCHTDGITQLYQHLISYSCCHHVLGNMTCSIGSRTVHLGRVLAAECSSAMGTLASVGVHDYLTARETGVSVRSTNDKLTRGVDIVLDVFIEECQYLGFLYSLQHARHQYLPHVPLYLPLHGLIAVKFIVLGGEDDGIDTQRCTSVGVFDSDLTFGIGTQISHLFALLAYFCQYHQKSVGQVESQWHVIVGLVGCISKHHTLVASSLFLGCLSVHASVYVGTLFVNGTQHATTVSVKHILGLGVANTVDYFTCHALKVDIRFAGNLSR